MSPALYSAMPVEIVIAPRSSLVERRFANRDDLLARGLQGGQRHGSLLAREDHREFLAAVQGRPSGRVFGHRVDDAGHIAEDLVAGLVALGRARCR